jgi:hypothetical protein
LRKITSDLSMTRRLAEVARKVGVSEATVSRVLIPIALFLLSSGYSCAAPASAARSRADGYSE